MPGPLFVNDLAPVKCKVKGNSNDFVHNTVFFYEFKKKIYFSTCAIFFSFLKTREKMNLLLMIVLGSNWRHW